MSIVIDVPTWNRAIEAAAAVLDAIVKEHRDEQEAMARKYPDDHHHLCKDGAFCEDYGCGSFVDAASAIRALATAPAALLSGAIVGASGVGAGDQG